MGGPGGNGPRATEKLNEKGGGGGSRKRRRRTRRGGKRRKRRKGDGWVNLKVLHCNIRGYTSKQESLAEILKTTSSDICNLNETNLRGKRKINIQNYVSFNKNREEKLMGGVSTSFQNHLKQHAVKVADNIEGDEYIITRLESVQPALNIFNIYGLIESRASQEDILESWGRIKKELALIEIRGEAVLMSGDFNRAVGGGELGVAGNKEKISFGGQLIRDLIDSEEYVILNNLDLSEGGPWTWVDPADPSHMSCLDLAIVSKNMLPYVTGMRVDSSRRITPKRVTVSRRGKMTVKHTDHFALEIKLKIPEKPAENKNTAVWNLRKPGGWETYKKLTDDIAEDLEKLVENNDIDIDTIVRRADDIQERVRFKAFGKTKTNFKKLKELDKVNEVSDEVEAKELMRKQSDKMEAEILKVTSSKLGRCGKVFKMREVVAGPKKGGQEAKAVKHSRSEIRMVGLE